MEEYRRILVEHTEWVDNAPALISLAQRSHVLARGIATEYDQKQIVELLGLLPEADRSYWAKAFTGKKMVDGTTFDHVMA